MNRIRGIIGRCFEKDNGYPTSAYTLQAIENFPDLERFNSYVNSLHWNWFSTRFEEME